MSYGFVRIVSAQALRLTLIGKGGATSSLAEGKKPVPKSPPKPRSLLEGKVKPQPTEFRRFYDRGDLPLQVTDNCQSFF